VVNPLAPSTTAPVPEVPQHKKAPETIDPPGTINEPLTVKQASPLTMFDAPASTGTPTPATPASPVTFEQVKEALQKIAAVRPTDTNEMAGLNRATEIIGKVQTGCRKIKDIKPENYAATLAACLTA
jgi:hypothetical protein